MSDWSLADWKAAWDAHQPHELGDDADLARSTLSGDASIALTPLAPYPDVQRSNMQEPFFFDQDDSCHWYMVPERLREQWKAWKELDPDDQESWELPEGAVAVGGGISDIVVVKAGA